MSRKASLTGEDTRNVYRSQPIAEIKNGSLSNSRTSSNCNLSESHVESSNLGTKLLKKMADESMLGGHADSGNFSLGGSTELLATPPSESADQTFKTKWANVYIVY